MRLVVAAPLRIEARLLRTGLAGATVVRAGMGRRRALAAGQRLAATAVGSAAPTGPHSAVAVVGFGGGLDPALRAGQVVVATSISAADASVPSVTLPGAVPLAAALRRAGFDVVTGPLVSSPRVARGDRRAALAAAAIAVDMESAWLFDGLVRAGVDRRRLAAVRVIADTADRRLVSPAMVGGGVEAARVLRRLGPVLEQWAGALGSRRVLRAGPRSFCAGVNRAIAVVERAIERYGAPVYVRRQVVHNTHVVGRLEGLGAVFVREVDDIPEGATVVLAAHGVAPSVRHEARQRHLTVIDATCPLVAKVHHEAQRHRDAGRQIVLIGHADHEEVVGTRGEAPELVSVVEHPDDVAGLVVEDADRVVYLTQTTLAPDETASIVEALQDRFPSITGPRADDICYATQNRQEAARAVAAECDLVVVVGSVNSSNGNRLAEVVRRTGVDAVLVEDASELDFGRLGGAATIGLTAAASAPEELVDEVVAMLDALGPTVVEERRLVDETVEFRLPVEVR